MIPKHGKDPHNPLSYRPMSLLNIMGKIFEKILNNCFKTILETDNIIPKQQFGFRPQHSITNPILELHTDSTRHANLKECTIAVLLDIERAFDKVWHDSLLHKLISLRLNPSFIKLIDSFLSNRTCKVKIRNTLSHPVNIKAGVPQGSVLSPILYLIYCTDFPFADQPRSKTSTFLPLLPQQL
jgi:retron-type reverse transcriptase